MVIGAEAMDAEPVRITLEDVEKKHRESVQLDVMEPVMPVKKEEPGEESGEEGNQEQ